MTDSTPDAIRQYLKACGNGKTGMTLELTYAQAKQLIEVHDTLLDRLAAVEGDVVPRSRYDAANTDWLQVKEKLKTVQESARIEIESLQKKLAAAEQVVALFNTMIYCGHLDMGGHEKSQYSVAPNNARKMKGLIMQYQMQYPRAPASAERNE